MTTDTMTLTTTSDRYRCASDRLMCQAEAEYERGDLFKASEKAWDAAVQQLKALATIREMPHDEHWALRMVASQIVDETGQRRIGQLFNIGESLHFILRDGWIFEDEVRPRMDNMKELIDLLRQVPPPSENTPIRRYKTRPFFRDRGDG